MIILTKKLDNVILDYISNFPKVEVVIVETDIPDDIPLKYRNISFIPVSAIDEIREAFAGKDPLHILYINDEDSEDSLINLLNEVSFYQLTYRKSYKIPIGFIYNTNYREITEEEYMDLKIRGLSSFIPTDDTLRDRIIEDDNLPVNIIDDQNISFNEPYSSITVTSAMDNSINGSKSRFSTLPNMYGVICILIIILFIYLLYSISFQNDRDKRRQG